MKLISRIFRDDSGATAIEYGLIAALISVAAIVAFTTVGENLNSMMMNTSNSMQ